MTCTNCQQPSETEYCPNCEQFRGRLERLRAEQRQFWRDVRSGKRQLIRPTQQKKGGAHFLMQTRKFGPALVAQRAAEKDGRMAQKCELPLSGQDAALPNGDRDE